MKTQSLEYSRDISGISAANPAVVTLSADHGLEAGFVDISGVIDTMGPVVNGTRRACVRASDTTLTMTGLDTTGLSYTAASDTAEIADPDNRFDNLIPITDANQLRLGAMLSPTDKITVVVDNSVDPSTAFKDVHIAVWGRAAGDMEWHLIQTIDDHTGTWVVVHGATRFTSFYEIPRLPEMKITTAAETSGTGDYKLAVIG